MSPPNNLTKEKWFSLPREEKTALLNSWIQELTNIKSKKEIPSKKQGSFRRIKKELEQSLYMVLEWENAEDN